MIHDQLLDGIRKNIWATASSYDGDGVPTMLSSTELKMLAWLGEHYDFDPDDFVADLGSFLGGSTRAMASGIAARSNPDADRGRIQSYDMFKVPNDDYSRGLLDEERAIGSTVLDLFLINIREYRNIVRYYPGDVQSGPVTYKNLAIAFVDLAKSPELNRFVITRFFDILVPQRSLVIQQDHNDHSCPWIAISMEYLKDCFDYLADDGSSRVFLNTSRVPTNAATEIRRLSLKDQCDLLEAASARSMNPISGYLVLSAKAWIVQQQSGQTAALSFLETIRDGQPWSGEPYVDHVAQALRYVASAGGMNAYVENYFGA